jgi:hypothetical protein
MEPNLEGLVADVGRRNLPVNVLITEIPSIFDHHTWSFSPESFLTEERDRVEAAVPNGAFPELLAIVPGKQLIPVAAGQVGMNGSAYTELILGALRREREELNHLATKLEAALSQYLPSRRAPNTLAVAPV